MKQITLDVFLILAFLLIANSTRITKEPRERLQFVRPEDQIVSLQVPTVSGLVQGLDDVTLVENTPYVKYLGIPYAAPPVRELRWQVPPTLIVYPTTMLLYESIKVPKPSYHWRPLVLDATVERPFCVQMSTNEGIEDCLYINVYIPKTNKDPDYLYPVMVWIYGGRFANGNSNYTLYGPDYLLERDVAYVSFNYRLGIFGFLSSSDLNLPGNYGLKDQVFALKWIHENVANFGGDPNSVTIFGDSSGAACVSYLLLIPQARGLFHRAIMQSGSALCPWAFQRDPHKILTILAYGCGIFDSNVTVILQKLRRISTRKLRNKIAIEPLNGLPFAPTVEPDHDDAVLTNHSNELFNSGQFSHVPFVIGFTAQEASIVQDVIERTRPYIAHWDLIPQLLVPANLNVSSKVKRKEIAMKIKAYYFGRKLIALSSKTEMMNFIGDSQFVRSIRHNVQVCAKYTQVYFYVFSYEGYIGRYGTKKEVARKVKGAGHVEDVFYLFRKANITTTNETDWRIISEMTELWTNFAKRGTPTPLAGSNIDWPPINLSSSGLTYLDIDRNLSIKSEPRADAMDFWDDLYKEYGCSFYNTFK